MLEGLSAYTLQVALFHRQWCTFDINFVERARIKYIEIVLALQKQCLQSALVLVCSFINLGQPLANSFNHIGQHGRAVILTLGPFYVESQYIFIFMLVLHCIVLCGYFCFTFARECFDCPVTDCCSIQNSILPPTLWPPLVRLVNWLMDWWMV